MPLSSKIALGVGALLAVVALVYQIYIMFTPQ